MGPTGETSPEAERAKELERVNNMFVLEVCFLAVLGIVVLAAFIEAMTYPLVSSRTPFVIMVPLLGLIAFQSRRLLRVPDKPRIRRRVGIAVNGGSHLFRKVMGMLGWFVMLMALIVVAGHYVGIAAFVLLLTAYAGREKLMLAIILTVATTLILYVVFEHGFNIELYRGLIWRYYAGYRVF